MKQHSKFPLLLLLFMLGSYIGYTQPKPSVAVLPLDAKGISLSPQELWSMAIRSTEKTEVYLVRDKYDLAEMVENKGLNLGECFGLKCLGETGEALEVDWVISGAVEKAGDQIFVTIKLVNVATGQFEKKQIMEFLKLDSEISDMLDVTIRTMVGLENDPELVRKLSREDDYPNSVNEPHRKKIVNIGPRMGAAYLGGENGQRLMDPISEGGWDLIPVMSQMGFQLEVQYLSKGRLQALVEFLGLASGLEQGRFVPSLTIMNGFRDSQTGIEFAVGPSLNVVPTADGYYDEAREWQLAADWDTTGVGPIPYDIINRIDSRGIPEISSGMVFALGKTFKSGAVNMPLNAWIKPQRGGWSAGINFGINIVSD